MVVILVAAGYFVYGFYHLLTTSPSSSSVTYIVIINTPVGLTVVPNETPTVGIEPYPEATTPSITLDPTSPSLMEVEVGFLFEDCSCNGKFEEAILVLKIHNGELPFSINGQAPVRYRQVTFSVPVGVSFPLTITSFDGLRWEVQITVPPSGSCQPPTYCDEK